MSREVPRYLAFRVFGNFHWPPLRGDFDDSTNDPDPKDLKKGVLEIYFAPKPGGASEDLTAYLRWKAKEDDEAPTPIPFTGDFENATDIYDPDPVLKSKFLEDDEVLLRLVGGTPQPGKIRRLLFRGAFLFDQFLLVDSDDPPMDMRWVLARSFSQYAMGGAFRNYFSEVVIGQEGQPSDDQTSGSRIRFNFALPTPGAQSGDAQQRCYALPFAAIFSAVQQKSAAPASLPVEWFIAGPGPSDSLQDAPGVAMRWGSGHQRVSDLQLGHFGFCAGDKAGGEQFLYFPRFSRGKRNFPVFWPTSAKAFIEDFLAILSGSARPGRKPEDLLELEHDAADKQGELAHSVRFDTSSGGARTVMIFRTRVRVGDPWPWPQRTMPLTDDIRVVGWHFLPPGRPPSFQLREPGSANNWLDTRSDTLHIDREIAYTVAPDAIWSLLEDRSAVGGEITVRLGFAEKGKNYYPPPGQPPADFLPDLFERAVGALRLPRLDLQNIADGQPQSILPDIKIKWPDLPDVPWPSSPGSTEPEPATPRFMFSGSMPFAFQSTATGSVRDAREAMVWRKRYPSREVWAGLNLNLGFWRDANPIAGDPVIPERIPITLALVSFSYGASPLNLYLTADRNVPSDDPRWCQFRIVPGDEPATIKDPIRARLGGLEFAGSDTEGVFREEDDGGDYSHWRFADRVDPTADVPKGWRLTDVDLRLRLKIASIRPIATDTPWGDRSSTKSPLLIPTDGDTGRGTFVLDLRETVAAADDRQLTASIYSRAFGADSGTYVILSEEPFTITRLHAQPLQGRGAQDNALVATFDADTRQWQVKLAADTYHYEFPPQVMGESMDKPRRLEIEDLPANEQVPWDKTLPPAVAPVRVEGEKSYPRAIEFRLTPSADIWIRPSDVERGYFLPEWASHEIFRQRGDLGIGAALAALRAEFLYGLSVGIDPSREVGAARSARVAEIEALTGRPPRKLGASNVTGALAQRWMALDDALARRPERIEIWARDPSSSVPLAPAKFADGVTFALRRTALHRPPIDDTVDNTEDATAKVRFSKHGLSGGALWPLESRNFFNALVQNPGSTGGTIEQIALSPIGGDANQKAEFLNSKVRIISETRNGFVQRHKIEIIGRIAVFWHWAKYVVVYERTVNPSAQFTPDGGIRLRTRRPVLRKVSEYIFIRQPQGIRRYPDFAGAKPSSAGLLKAVKFNSITINVDSAWSEDVEQYGWRIPLWNREAARRRPQVYPRPDIAFSTVAEGQGEEAETSQECIEPDNVYFYADASPTTTVDTDTWLSLVGIDCSALPPPSHAFQRALDADDPYGDGTNTRPSASRVPRGHRRFTWRLAPPAKKAVLNAGRSEKPLYAGLESITFMRSNAQAPSEQNDKNVQALANMLSATDNIKDSPPANKLPYWPADARAPDAFSEVNAFMDAVAAGDSGKVRTTAQDLAHALTTNIHTRKGVKDAIEAASSYVAHDKLGNLWDSLKKDVTKGPSRCQQVADGLIGSIKRKQLLILDAVGIWQSDADDAIPAAPPASVSDLKAMVVAGLAEAVHRSLSGLDTDTGQIELGVNKARGMVDDFESDVRQAEDALELQLNGMKAAYDDKKPWSSARLGEFEGKWIANCNRVLAAISTIVEEIGVRVTTELDDVSQPIATTLHDAILTTFGAGSTLKDDADQAWSLTASYLDAAIVKFDAFLAAQNGKDPLDRLNDKLAEFAGKIRGRYPNLASDIDEVRQSLPQIRALAVTVRADLQYVKDSNPQIEISTLVDGAVRDVTDLLREIAGSVTQVAAVLEQAVDDTVKDAVAAMQHALDDFTQFVSAGVGIIGDFGSNLDGVVSSALGRIHSVLENDVFRQIDDWLSRIDDSAGRVVDAFQKVKDLTSSDNVARIVTDYVLKPAVDAVFASVTDAALTNYASARTRLLLLINDTSDCVQQELDTLDSAASKEIDAIAQACSKVAGGLQCALDYLQDMENKVKDEATAIADEWLQPVLDAANDLQKLANLAEGFVNHVRHFSNDVSASYASAVGYGNRVLEVAGNLGAGGIGAVPGNILRLYAAAASAPTLPNLEFARDRLAYYYKELNDVVDTTPVEAWFGRLGDELKALGLSIPFSQIGDHIVPDDLSNFDISRIFKNFSGMKLDNLFNGYKLPPEARDAIKVTHAFEKAQARAWVEIDVDLPMPDRKAMFSIGPFELDYVDSRFSAMVRLEASKDTDKVDEIGRAALTTNFEAVVSGQTMVSFERVVVRYEKSSGLKVDFDPKNIRLNAIFQFVQDTLASIFPDEIGGLKVIKDNGIPVGIEHVFAMPPLDLDFATSGVTNIVISNRFGLIAFPEFVIFDRFSLSRPELPFIFSIFVIGGTGYITIDAEYHPFQNNGLMVTVEAGAGGSAQIGFAFGVVSGSVFMTLSVALTYKKVFGKPGGGLTISLVLVVAGNVDVAGIITIYIGLLLRLSYQDNGAIDATGTLTVTIQITRFFSIDVSANVQYRLRGGKSEMTTKTGVSANVDRSLRDAANKLADARTSS